MKKATNIITIGASAGGIFAVSKFCAALGEIADTAVFVVLHMARSANAEVVINKIQKYTPLTCKLAANGEQIIAGNLYLAPPNHHLMLDADNIIVGQGAFENHWRPSIDVLFRTAAASHGACVIGVVLTGMLNDGSSGLLAVRLAGGKCLVQDPNDAEFPDMPLNAIKNVDPDGIASLQELGYIAVELTKREACTRGEVPEQVEIEATITRRMSSSVADQEKLGKPISVTCPDCGGALVEIKEPGQTRYRCFTGHAFTQQVLLDEQARSLEESVWVAIRMMEERKLLLGDLIGTGMESAGERHAYLSVHIERLKEMLNQLIAHEHKN